MSFPIKLVSKGGPDVRGHRRLELLERLADSAFTTMSLMDDEEGREDLRWLWRNGLVTARDLSRGDLGEGIGYFISFPGAETLAQADEARARAIEKIRLASQPLQEQESR